MSEPINLEAAEYKDGKLIFTVSPQTALFRFLHGFSSGLYEITKARKKRSNAANNLCWELCTRIGQLINEPTNDVYRKAVRDYGVKELYSMPRGGYERFKREWREKGIAWFCELWDDNGGATVDVAVYYGSSSYDTAEMSRLINGIMQEAQQLGIETMPKEELESLLNSWAAKR